jgi:hypothetical protein
MKPKSKKAQETKSKKHLKMTEDDKRKAGLIKTNKTKLDHFFNYSYLFPEHKENKVKLPNKSKK